MKKSVKVYMLQDLALLAIIGAILEALVQRFASTVLSGTPTIAFALFITFLAVARWNLWGLLVIPFMAAGTWIGGIFGEIQYYADAYDWRVFISECIGLLAIGVNVIAFRGHRTKKVMSSPVKVIALIIVDYVLYCGIQFIVYRLLTSGNILKTGDISATYTVFERSLGQDIEDGAYVEKVINVCKFIEQGFIYNLFGLVIALVGIFILRSQGIVNNAVDKIVDDKRLAEAEAEYLNSLGNADSEEAEAEAENDVSNDTNEDLGEKSNSESDEATEKKF